MKNQSRTLVFRSGESVSKATKGERCCTLIVNSRKAARVVGGKQRMTRVFCQWLEKEYQDRLQYRFREDINRMRETKQFKRLHRFVDFRTIKSQELPAVHIAEEHKLPMGLQKGEVVLTVSLELVTDFVVATSIAQEIGIELSWVEAVRETETFYNATIFPYGNIESKETHGSHR